MHREQDIVGGGGHWPPYPHDAPQVIRKAVADGAMYRVVILDYRVVES